jgi:hypothetical protein
MIKVRGEVEYYLNNKYYNMLTNIWDERSENC